MPIKGKVIMQISKQNVMDAVSEWLTKQLTTTPIVSDIKPPSSSSYDGGEYTVTFEQVSDENPAS